MSRRSKSCPPPSIPSKDDFRDKNNEERLKEKIMNVIYDDNHYVLNDNANGGILSNIHELTTRELQKCLEWSLKEAKKNNKQKNDETVGRKGQPGTKRTSKRENRTKSVTMLESSKTKSKHNKISEGTDTPKYHMSVEQEDVNPSTTIISGDIYLKKKEKERRQKKKKTVAEKRADIFSQYLEKYSHDGEEWNQFEYFYRPMICNCLLPGSQLLENDTSEEDSFFFLHIGSGSGLLGQAISAISNNCISLGIEGDSLQHIQSTKRSMFFYKQNYWKVRYLSIGPQNITNFTNVTHLYLQLINSSKDSNDQEMVSIAKMFNKSKTCKYLIILQNHVTPIQVRFKVKQNAIMTYCHPHTNLILRIFLRIDDDTGLDKDLDGTSSPRKKKGKFNKTKIDNIMASYNILKSNDKTVLINYYRSIIEQHFELKKGRKLKSPRS